MKILRREEKRHLKIDKRHKTKGIFFFFSYVKGLQKFSQEVKFLYLKEPTVGLHFLQNNDQLLIHYLTSPTVAIHNRSLTLGYSFLSFFLCGSYGV